MGPTRVFFPQLALDQWLREGLVEFYESRLTVVEQDQSFRVTEAVHVLAEVSGTPDPFELAGKVKTTAYLSELGAELLEGSMVVGDNAYDVVPGWLGTPEHLGVAKANGSGDSDEELLARYLMRTL